MQVRKLFADLLFFIEQFDADMLFPEEKSDYRTKERSEQTVDNESEGTESERENELYQLYYKFDDSRDQPERQKKCFTNHGKLLFR